MKRGGRLFATNGPTELFNMMMKLGGQYVCSASCLRAMSTSSILFCSVSSITMTFP